MNKIFLLLLFLIGISFSVYMLIKTFMILNTQIFAIYNYIAKKNLMKSQTINYYQNLAIATIETLIVIILLFTLNYKNIISYLN